MNVCVCVWRIGNIQPHTASAQINKYTIPRSPILIINIFVFSVVDKLIIASFSTRIGSRSIHFDTHCIYFHNFQVCENYTWNNRKFSNENAIFSISSNARRTCDDKRNFLLYYWAELHDDISIHTRSIERTECSGYASKNLPRSSDTTIRVKCRRRRRRS